MKSGKNVVEGSNPKTKATLNTWRWREREKKKLQMLDVVTTAVLGFLIFLVLEKELLKTDTRRYERGYCTLIYTVVVLRRGK